MRIEKKVFPDFFRSCTVKIQRKKRDGPFPSLLPSTLLFPSNEKLRTRFFEKHGLGFSAAPFEKLNGKSRGSCINKKLHLLQDPSPENRLEIVETKKLGNSRRRLLSKEFALSPFFFFLL